MQAENNVHAQHNTNTKVYASFTLKGKLTQVHGSSLRGAVATAKDTLALLQLPPLSRSPAASTHATPALAEPRPKAAWHARRVMQELDRLALQRLYAYYDRPFALPSTLDAKGPLRFWQQDRRIARATETLSRHIAVAEGHPCVGHMVVKPQLQVAQDGNGVVFDLFAAISHERSFGLRVPLLGHVRRTEVVGPSGFVPVLLLRLDDGGVLDLASDVGPTFAERGSLYFKRPSFGHYADPFLPKNAEAEGRVWSAGFLVFSGTSNKFATSTITNPGDVAEAARLARARS